MAFHEVRFPLDIAMHARGGPERRTDVVTAGSGREERNARWQHARRRYDAGYGVKSLAAIEGVLSFFEERRGMLYGFRWRDRADFKSCPMNATPSPLDQVIGVGTGSVTTFQLCKTYGKTFAPYQRIIQKPVDGSIRVGVNGAEKIAGLDFVADPASGQIVFMGNQIPPQGSQVSAGFLFDVPVRFDTDYLEIDLAAFDAGNIPKIPLIEIRI